MANKNLKYACRKCGTVKSAKFVIENNIETEVFKPYKDTETGQEKKARGLECGHFIPTHYPGFTDISSENLNEQETAAIRREIEKRMTGKVSKDFEAAILFAADEYNTLLKIHSKGKLATKYAIQYVDQLRERYSATLADKEEKEKFETKFYHFLDLKPTTEKTIQREKTKTERDATKQLTSIEAGAEAMKAQLTKMGYDPKELIKQMLAKSAADKAKSASSTSDSTTANSETKETKEGV